MKKTRWVILGLTLLISIAVYVNWIFINTDNNVFTVEDDHSEIEDDKILGQSTYVNAAPSDYFDNARFLRKKNREDAIAVLNDLILNESADTSARKAAANAVTEYARMTENEAVLESLILAKGFTDCIAYIGIDNVSIVVETDGLEAHQAAQIMDIAASETKFSPNVIKIIEIGSIQN